MWRWHINITITILDIIRRSEICSYMKKPVNIYVSNPYFETRVLFTLFALYVQDISSSLSLLSKVLATTSNCYIRPNKDIPANITLVYTHLRVNILTAVQQL
jgi:hypothetical protein